MWNYPYLNDKEFLKKITHYNHKEQYIKIFILDFKTESIKASIEGKSTGGSINQSGTSNIRRSGSCSLIVDKKGVYDNDRNEYVQYHNILEIENLISLNKKVRIMTGFKNPFSQYSDYEIIWFPLGVFVIKNANVSNNGSGLNISLTLSDKTALLNGDIGGLFPATMILSEKEYYDTTGFLKKEKLTFKDIIYYIMTSFGNERASNIFIDDIPNKILKVVQWNGQSSCFFGYTLTSDGDKKNKIYVTEKEQQDIINKQQVGEIEWDEKYQYGQNIGYTLENFTYPGSLEAKAGDSVASILDKIKNVLGNFEWFYDIYGLFHFQKKKNFINSVPTIEELNSLTDQDFFSYTNPNLATYSFNNKEIITGISNAPQYGNVKNDYIVWGSRKLPSGGARPIRYHVSFNSKPSSITEFDALIYTDSSGLYQVIPLLEGYTYKEVSQINEMVNQNIFYYIENEKKYYHWDSFYQTFRPIIIKSSETSDEPYEYIEKKLSSASTDWRYELYLRALKNNAEGKWENDYYGAELLAEFPKLFDVITEKYKTSYASNCDYWLDFIEGQSGGRQNISQFNVDKIGYRQKIITESSCTQIFPTKVPFRILAKAGENFDYQDVPSGYEVIQVSEQFYRNLGVGSAGNSAFEKVKELIYTHSNYAEKITLTTIPIYYLEPNIRIEVNDQDTSIFGDYLIDTISLPLNINGTSSISATKCIEKNI